MVGAPARRGPGASCAAAGSCSPAARSHRRWIAAGMALRQQPSGVALRGYVRNEAMRGRIDKRSRSSGIAPSRPATAGSSLPRRVVQRRRRRLHRTRGQPAPAVRRLHAHLPGRARAGDGRWAVARRIAAERRAAALLAEGARFSRPGLLVSGEAAGSTYAFTGEGHRLKALETGMHAAEALLPVRARSGRFAAVRADYEARLEALAPRFTLYERANWVNRHPWLADLVQWRGTRSERARRRMSGVLDESSNLGQLLTAKGFTASSPNSARHVPAARPERQHAHRRGVQFTGFSTRAEEHKDGFGIASSRARRACLQSMRRARAIRRWPRWCGATRSRAQRHRPHPQGHAGPGGAGEHAPCSSASCGAATGCSRTTAT